MMDSHGDHLGHGPGHRPQSETDDRQIMMPPFHHNLQPHSHYHSAPDIPSTNRPSPIPVDAPSLFTSQGTSSNRRSVADGGAGVSLQTSPIAMNGGSSPDSHTGSAAYTWTPNEPWPGRSSQQQYNGNRTPGTLNQSSFYMQGLNSMPTTTSHNLSPITTTTPADSHPSFHSSPATSMSHLSIDQAASNGGNHGTLPPFRQNSTGYSSRPTPPMSRTSSFTVPTSTMPAYVPSISSILPMGSNSSSARHHLASPISPLGSSTPTGPPSQSSGPSRLSDYASGHQQHQYMHNLANPGGPMALVSHYSPNAVAPYGSHYSGMMFPQQQRTPENKPHQCDQCPTAFTRNHDLKRHKRIHWSIKPYPCDGCDKAFSRKDALKRHKLVKCCGGKEDKVKKEGSPSSSGSQPGRSGGSSPVDSRRLPN